LRRGPVVRARRHVDDGSDVSRARIGKVVVFIPASVLVSSLEGSRRMLGWGMKTKEKGRVPT
jgi:hypothetical protein